MRKACAPHPTLRDQQHGSRYRKALDEEGLDEGVKTRAGSDRAWPGHLQARSFLPCPPPAGRAKSTPTSEPGCCESCSPQSRAEEGTGQESCLSGSQSVNSASYHVHDPGSVLTLAPGEEVPRQGPTSPPTVAMARERTPLTPTSFFCST